MPEQRADMQTITDPLDPARAAALHASLDLPGPPPAPGDPLPAFWHQIYFWDPQPPGQLGRDGHPKTGTGLIPDLGLPQRMWAGGRLEFHAPLRLGQPATRVSQVEDVTEKIGRSGRLGFVTLRHEISQSDTLCVTEFQDLVYRQPPSQRQSIVLPRARDDAAVMEDVRFSPTLLFRYSALTFNGHRIHYDADYARDVEGYAGLVVHGPLLAQLLMGLATRQIGALKRFSSRATSALTVGEEAQICWADDGTLWVRAQDGRQCMQASAN